MKENKIKELQEELETLHVTQDARLACNADDLDIREEIAEVEEEIKELQDDTNADRENNIKNERSSIEDDIKELNQEVEILEDNIEEIEELDRNLKFDDLITPYGKNEDMMWTEIIKQHNKIDEIIRYIKRKDKSND